MNSCTFPLIYSINPKTNEYTMTLVTFRDNIIDKYIKYVYCMDGRNYSYIDIMNITKQDLKKIKKLQIKCNTIFKEFILLLKYPYYKNILTEFLKKNPEWLEYLI
jgi:ABC-type phosphate/phosphonate transport system ATPase subunit